MSFLRNPWLTLALRLVLGGFFIAAAYHKIADPPDFAKAVYNYKIVPGEFLHVMALFLPWFEALAGLALLSGVGVRGGAAATFLLSAVFLAALSYNLYRGHPTICGCFTKFAAGQGLTDAEKFAKMWREVFLDCGLLLVATLVLYGAQAGSLVGVPRLFVARRTA